MEKIKELINSAIDAINDGRIEDAILTLERTANPKYGSESEARLAYNRNGRMKLYA